ncbi:MULTISPECIES: DUF397 domain-containing protein [unclassified Streptomyces]|uniref:DUF397 domain-containing protein n=1 Tax=unclassified Streptomyces TaxID=2593676 RepID=UPI00093E51E4|nr:DUF397 domain-containing protein [Streptomyces sp. TSRI0107]OKJ87944.1 toxin [Streptomyces sp. TSRI0107]
MIGEPTAGDTPELAWFKSSYSDGPEGDSCVEIAITPRAIHVRDSKSLGGPQLALPPAAWAGFLSYARQSQ